MLNQNVMLVLVLVLMLMLTMFYVTDSNDVYVHTKLRNLSEEPCSKRLQ